MGRYLIEVPHGGDKASCIRYIQAYLRPRTHYVSCVEWGSMEGENKAWLIIKTKNPGDALRIIPSAYRKGARITKLHNLSLEGLAAFSS